MDRLPDILKKFWGYDRFLPNQLEAMGCVIEGRDSMTVLPTGGGKSICYQAPAIALPGMAVVVSPLIALMKDQIDALVGCGVPAACINSSMTMEDRRAVFGALRQGSLKILYVAPERLLMEGFLDDLLSGSISFFAIDEAHCISQWGHDFRPEYRQLNRLKERFPSTAIHTYTATANSQVRDDISQQLGLDRPEIIVGSFYRPNLIYSVERRRKRLEQIGEIIDRYRDESGIIYCLTRKEVEKVADQLQRQGLNAAPYHAGLDAEVRRLNQEAFTKDKLQIIVATVAFGMGIDKSNVRFVIHAGMPRSLEHYQQESGRAGRDGLDSECVLIYSGQDYALWQRMLADLEPEAYHIAQRKLKVMYDYCNSGQCRHAALLDYFGETLQQETCGSCDFCLGRFEPVPESLVMGQKILSSVVRQGDGHGSQHTAKVLTGSKSQSILSVGHDSLSTHGLLKDQNRDAVIDWITQLTAQQYLEQTEGSEGLRVTEKGWVALRGEATPRLLRLAERKGETEKRKTKKPRDDAEQWQGVDRDLFDMLRVLRRGLADAREVPAFVIFSDATLRAIARQRPSNEKSLLQVSGIGQHKAANYGEDFLRLVSDYCRAHDRNMDQA